MDVEWAKSTDDHRMPVTLGDPGVDNPLIRGKHQFDWYVLRACNAPRKSVVLISYFLQETESELEKLDFLPSPWERGWSPRQPWVRKDIPPWFHHYKKELTMRGRSCPLCAAQWEGAHPQASCRGGKDWVA